MAEHDWKIAKAGAGCALCNAQFSPGVQYFSALLQTAESLERKDYCVNCFPAQRPPEMYYYWKRTQPDPEAPDPRRQPVVDTEYVFDFFRRLEESGAPSSERGSGSAQRVAFRYILALMLTRKKVLIFETKKNDPSGIAIHVYRERRGGQAHEVYEPVLNEEEVLSVSAELGVLLGLTPPPVKIAPATEVPVAGEAAVQVDTSQGE